MTRLDRVNKNWQYLASWQRSLITMVVVLLVTINKGLRWLFRPYQGA